MSGLLGGPAQAPKAAVASPAGSPQWASASPAQGAFGAFAAAGEALRACVRHCLLQRWARWCQPANAHLSRPHTSCALHALPSGQHGVLATTHGPASPPAKLGGSSPGMVSLTASAVTGSPPPLPAYLFAEPTPPAYASAASWGTHVAGAVAPQAHSQAQAKVASPKAEAAPGGPDLFADFSPFK